MSHQTDDPDRRRRRVLQGALGATGLGAVPWLAGCGDSSSAGMLLPGGTSARGIHVSLGADTRRERFVTWFTDGLEPPPSVLEFGPALSDQPLDAPLPGRVEGTAARSSLTHDRRMKFFSLKPRWPRRP